MPSKVELIWQNYFDQVDKLAEGGFGHDANSIPPPPAGGPGTNQHFGSGL